MFTNLTERTCSPGLDMSARVTDGALRRHCGQPRDVGARAGEVRLSGF